MMKTILSLLLMFCATGAWAHCNATLRLEVREGHYENRGFKALMNGKIPVEVMLPS